MLLGDESCAAVRYAYPMKARFEDPRVTDWLIAITMLVLGLISVVTVGDNVEATIYRDRDAIAYLLIGLQTIPLAWRRTHPRIITVVIALAWSVDRWMENVPTAAGFALVVAMHAVGAYLPPKASKRFGIGAVTALLAWTLVGVFFSDPVTVEAIPSTAATMILPLVIGREIYQRRQRIIRLEERAEKAEREREEKAREAVAQERERIARELHDVIAHEMTVMALQAEGALRIAKDVDPRITNALDIIASSGRSTLKEMQSMVSLLRSNDQHDDLAPQPTLAALPALVESVDDAGLPVTMDITGSEIPLSAIEELTAYRVIQESLTNSLRYAGPGAAARVVLAYEPTGVRISVTDDGRGAAANRSEAGGHGLAGMRERIALHDGEFRAGPKPGGGYEVVATLPAQP